MCTNHDVRTAGSVWAELMEGNRRWRSHHVSRIVSSKMSAKTQSPKVAVLGCSDSRVPTQLIFSQGAGDIFSVRTAGHTLDDAVLGSLDYAISVLKVPLVVVLGHQACGAVALARDYLGKSSLPDGWAGTLVAKIRPAVRAELARNPGTWTHGEISEHVEHANVAGVVSALMDIFPQLERLTDERAASLRGGVHGTAIIGAHYHIEDESVVVVNP